MKIGIDARLFGPRHGGLGRYVQELVTHLSRMDTEHEFVIFLGEDGFDLFHTDNPKWHKRLAPIKWYTLSEQWKMPGIIDGENCDIIHYPHWNVPLRAKTPFIVTVHDLILLDQTSSAHQATTLPPALYKLKWLAFTHVLRHALTSSQKVITVSEFVKNDILSRFPNVHSAKITVTLEGTTNVGAANTPHPLRPTAPYFLYVGSAFPHKNLESLLHAFSLFHRMHPDAKLVLAGKLDSFYESLIKEVREIDLPDDAVVFPGFVPDEQLADLYTHASLYIFPSRHEGFGLPPLEAMNYGVPVAAAKATALPEILGEHALYFDPDNIEEMVEIMQSALENPTKMKELGMSGKDHAQSFNWQDMAQKTLNLYTSA